MARYIGPKEKIERRLGKKLMLKGERSLSSKSATVRRMYPPGVHGKASGRRTSDFGAQLQSKQRVKKLYGMLERQFKNWVKIAIKAKGEAVNSLVLKLEHRLDNVVYKSGIAQSRSQARQIVNHGHIRVNGKRVSIPSYCAKHGDVIDVRPESMKSKFFATLMPQWLVNYQVPQWIQLDASKPTAKISGIPTIEDSGLDLVDVHAVIEFYSR